jgi:hypothetical protein
LSRHHAIGLFLVLLGVALPGPVAANDLTGSLSLEGGFLDHPLGVAVEPSSPYGQGALSLLWLPGGSGRWRLTYEGSATVFDSDVPLDDTRHAAGLEWVRPRPREGWTLSAGGQASLRRQTEYYRVYDHDEAYGYLAFKHYPHPRVMVRGWVGLRSRTYRDLPEESYLEPHAVLEAKRFGGGRTTLGASLRLGGKWFHDPVAPQVWGTAGTPVTSQLSLALNGARGLSDRVGVRAALQLRRGLREFPYYVEEDLYDSPLLDRYARSGPAASAAVKWLTPLQAWFEVGGFWTRDDYGAILFADGLGGGARRRDTIVDAFASLERRLLRDGRGVILRARVSWRDQSSDLPGYTWSGPAAAAGMEWRF